MVRNNGRKHLLKNSVQVRLTLLAACALVPMLLLLIINNLYSMELERTKFSQLNRNTVTLYANQIETTLEGIEKYVASLYTRDEDISLMIRSPDENQKKLASWRVMLQFDEALNIHQTADTFFIMTASEDNVMFRRRTNHLEFSVPLMNEIVRSIPDTRQWYWYQLENKYYLVRAFLLSDYYAGVFVNVDKLLALYEDLDFQGLDRLFIMTGDGLPLNDYMPGFEQQFRSELLLNRYQSYQTDNAQYIVIGTGFSFNSYILAAMMRDYGLFGRLSPLQKIITISIFVFLVYIPALLLLLRNRVIEPLNITVEAMKQMRNGDLDVQIPYTEGYDEFHMVHETFNSMAKDLKQSKIAVYEERLKRKETVLQFLQLQLSPHFIVNGLNSVHTLIDAGNLALSKQMVQYLAKHLQYAMQTSPFVTLKEELAFLENYINIQSLRYHHRIIPVIQYAKGLDDIAVPPLILQTFLENSIKYAFSRDDTVVFMLSISLEPNEDESNLAIEISDSGPGFPEKIICLMESGKKVTDERGEHFGISNVRDRLDMLYHGMASIRLSNQDRGGVRINIQIPAKTMRDSFGSK